MAILEREAHLKDAWKSSHTAELPVWRRGHAHPWRWILHLHHLNDQCDPEQTLPSGWGYLPPRHRRLNETNGDLAATAKTAINAMHLAKLRSSPYSDPSKTDLAFQMLSGGATMGITTPIPVNTCCIAPATRLTKQSGTTVTSGAPGASALKEHGYDCTVNS